MAASKTVSSKAPSGTALKAPVPPQGLLIDRAQQGGSSRGGEENTNPHPGSPSADRQSTDEEVTA